MRDGLDARLPGLGLLYRDLHSHPELSMQEHRTAGIVAAELRGQGWEVTEGVGGTGVVGVLRNGEGPVVALRADMDGLPVREATGLDYASTDTALSPDGEPVPLMHACGHDLHTAALLGATGQLAAHRELWRGTLLAIFQPGEETAAGARAMLADGLLERFPRPDVVLGQHVGPLPLGSVATRPGVVMAAADSLRARLLGRGGHGSAPHATVDPVVMAAATVMRLQGIVAREVSPTESAVVTVGSLRAGTKENIIPDEAELKINIRTFDAAVRERVLAAVRRTVEGEAATSGAPRPPEFSEINSFPLLSPDGQFGRGDGTRPPRARGGRRSGAHPALPAVGQRGLRPARHCGRVSVRLLVLRRHGAQQLGGRRSGGRAAAHRARQPLAVLRTGGGSRAA
ncbi:amidohydrolase [Streptomyces sp. NBC_01003]|uniref:amidohydrolase n=1 Tax=Streptomyces sp. NBC_01003 TaxID=2903714 RepID=UPI00386F20F3|nr:amidohydrolase [Streptomyces sp. NBC_01003]